MARHGMSRQESETRMGRSRLATVWVLILWASGCQTGPEKATEHSPWADVIRAFEEADRTAPPAPGSILFVGSSSIRLWNLAESFPDLPVVNRGFGGSQMADCVQFADRIVIPYRPQVVVLYAGDNDIAAGKPPEAVLSDFKAFTTLVLDRLPDCRIAFISIKPSPQRWRFAGEMRRANEIIREWIATDSRLSYVDVAKPMLGPDGAPRPELFAQDKLHMSPEGYRLWASTLRPVLEAAR